MDAPMTRPQAAARTQERKAANLKAWGVSLAVHAVLFCLLAATGFFLLVRRRRPAAGERPAARRGRRGARRHSADGDEAPRDCGDVHEGAREAAGISAGASRRDAGRSRGRVRSEFHACGKRRGSWECRRERWRGRGKRRHRRQRIGRGLRQRRGKRPGYGQRAARAARARRRRCVLHVPCGAELSAEHDPVGCRRQRDGAHYRLSRQRRDERRGRRFVGLSRARPSCRRRRLGLQILHERTSGKVPDDVPVPAAGQRG